nr:dihydrolipoamide acetyltransferase family protein [Paenibacillus sp. 32O-W]
MSMKTVTEIILPQLAESLVEATISQWLKQPGDHIEKYEPICDLITDKVNAELPSTVSGKLVKILVGNGETVPVGTAICLVETDEVSGETATGAPGGGQAGDGATAQAKAAGESMRGRYSPAVQYLAAEHGIDLRQVTGTGMGGRITRKDVLAYIAASGAESKPDGQEGKERQASSGQDANRTNTGSVVAIDEVKVPVRSSGLHLSETPKIPTVEVQGQSVPGPGEYFIDVTPVRNTIASRMRQSVSEIPHAWTMIEADVTNLVILRNKLKDEFRKREGINLTYLAFMMKAVVNAIKDYPIMNSVWAVNKIIVKREINLSMSVGTEDSVLTPVIKNADQKNIAGLAREIDDLARRTREGKLNLSDMQGGTFTVNNTGSFGSILSKPIINYPQAAILTFESIVKRPVVINDMIAVRSMVNICLSLDHRILDGVICGRFLQRVKDNLESYDLDTKLY